MSAFTLKIIALILMVIDHIGNFFPQVEGVLFMRMLGRIVAPIFFYMLVEGFIHTSNRQKYANRILTFAGIMFVGNFILSMIIKVLDIQVMYSINPLLPNIFLSMFLGLIILGDIEKIKFRTSVLDECGAYKDKKPIYISMIRIIVCMILSLYTEMSVYGLFMIFVFYLFRCNPVLKGLFYVIGSILLCFLRANFIQGFMVFAIFPLLFYNGKRGYSTPKSKYFFYIFYIAHIWIFVILSLFIN